MASDDMKQGVIFDITFCPHFSAHVFAKRCEAKVDEDKEKSHDGEV